MQSSSLPCPHCGQAFRLTREYLQNYGGGTTTCPACHQPFILPTLDEVFGSASPESVVQSDASFDHQAGSTAAIDGGRFGDGIWRDGWYAYVRRGAVLPECCFRCGELADLSAIDFELKYVRGTGPGYIGGGAEHFFHGETMVVQSFACSRHLSKVNIQRWIVGGLVALCFLCIIAAPFLLWQNHLMAGLACFVVPAPLLFISRLIIAASPTGLTATHIDQFGAYVSGFGRDFLLKLKPLKR